MGERARALLSAVASLPEDERAQLADAILLSLNPQPASALQGDAWLKEVKRRADEMDQGLVEGVPWDVVRAEGQALIDADD